MKQDYKIDLEDHPYASDNSGTISLTKSLPYYKSNDSNAKYYHRVRYGARHHVMNKTHYSASFWCGSHGLIGEKGRLSAVVPNGEVLCATCEGRAIGAGLDGSRIINGKKVMYSPRRQQF